MILQGVVSFISDSYYTLYKYTLNNIFHKIDIFMAIIHGVLGLLLHFSCLVIKEKRITELVILTILIFIGYFICFLCVLGILG